MGKKNLLPEDIPSIDNNSNSSVGLIGNQKDVVPDKNVDLRDPETEAKEAKMKEVRKKLQDAYKEPTVETIDPLTGEKVTELKSEVESRKFVEETKKNSIPYKIIGTILVVVVFVAYVVLVFQYIKMFI